METLMLKWEILHIKYKIFHFAFVVVSPVFRNKISSNPKRSHDINFGK